CALLLGYPKGGPDTTLVLAMKFATLVSLRKPSGEPVRVRVQKKPDGGERLICRYGRLDRSAKRLSDDILRVLGGVSPYEYSREGRGRDAAIRNALHSFNKGGVRRFV